MKQAYRFNREAKYEARGVYPPSRNLSQQLTRPSIVVTQTEGSSFEAEYPDVFERYRLPKVASNQIVQRWYNHPLDFWQNQLNFAVWCATTGCGVSAQDHLQATDPLLRSLYKFHVYYQIRRILAELNIALPQDAAWNALNSPYNSRAYQRICTEFGISTNTDWRRHGVNHGLGKVYNYWTNLGYHEVGDGTFDNKKMSFAKSTTNEVLHVDYIQQGTDAAEAWTGYVLNKSNGFTQPGVERLNDSIRTYVWAVVGAQAQTRTRILGTGTAFDAQKQFLANVEDAVSSPVDLPSAIKRYQDVLQYAGSKVDYCFGIGLYMAPSNMLLRIGQVAGYNNEIVIAGKDQKLGVNSAVNVSEFSAGNVVEKGLVSPQSPKTADGVVPTTTGDARRHVEEKTALIVGGIGVGLLALWAFDRL